MSEANSKKILLLEKQVEDRMREYQRFMQMFSEEGDHNAKERAQQILHVVKKLEADIAALKKI